MKLRRNGPGLYVTDNLRYSIERQENWTECSHPNCFTLHEAILLKEGEHLVPYYVWIVWDNGLDEYAGGNQHFDTKRDAVAWLRRHLGEAA